MNTLDIKFSDDPRFQHIADSLKALAYVFVHHIDIWIKTYESLEYMIMGFRDLSASQFFNHFIKSSEETSTMSDSTLSIIANTFLEAAKTMPIMKRYADDGSSDAVSLMWNMCHYFFVPVRLDDDTIPKDIKMKSLKYWLTAIFILPFNPEYASRYVNLVKKYTIVNESKNKLTPDKLAQFSGIKVDWMGKIIADYYTTGHATQEFVRVVMHLALLSSIDILKKYNPFIREACAINPNYDGRWIPPFGDEMINTQLRKINELTPLVKVKE